VYFTAAALALSAFSPEFLPGIFTTNAKAALLLRGMAVALVAGIFGELATNSERAPGCGSSLHATTAEDQLLARAGPREIQSPDPVATSRGQLALLLHRELVERPRQQGVELVGEIGGHAR
jgi:hypothetical protein